MKESTSPPANDREYLTTDEAADYLRVSKQQLEMWRCKGGGPAYLKLAGRIVRYRRTDLDAFADSRVRHHTSQMPATSYPPGLALTH